ncbi:hypothetical protein LUZ61_013493 [Rhynchospora tenuis]|uniref:Ethylene insensitive 3-like DNA-binding domain-containing protein n=1 Tax=Rhynchospora tenuis TaxID=198213 RepID=A0AAD5W9M9_9POAL|nr:hypothetical protein LUZ61_013493 [Rhynchospora tenuis]
MDKGKGILLPEESSNGQIDASATNNEAISSMAGPSRIQPETDSSERTNPNSYISDTDSSSEQSSPDEEPIVTEMRRRLAFYQEKLNKSSGQQIEERAEGKGKRKAKDPSAEIVPLEMELHRSHNIIERCFKKGVEEANLQGYAYGIVLEDGKVLSGYSDSLQKWWDEDVIFDQTGPAAADQFHAENQQNLNPANDDDPPKRTYDYLMQLSDATLASVQSAIMQACKPSQRKFPFRNKVQPPWWPTGDEPWWDQTGIDREEGKPPYKKPHDLRKKWKAVVVLAIMKSLAPSFRTLAQKARRNKNLQNRMTAREMNSWHSALKEEMIIYSREHPDMPLSNLLIQLQPQRQPQQQLQQQPQQNPVIPVENQQGDNTMLPWPNQRRKVRFTCQHLGCIHHDYDFGFRTAELRDHHQTNCRYHSTASSPATPVMFASMIPPSDSVSQVTAPPPFSPMHQPQQIVQPSFPPMFPSQSPPLPQMDGSTSLMNPPQNTWQFNYGVTNYPGTPSGSLNMGQQQPTFDCGGLYNMSSGNCSNIGSYMQLLTEGYPDTSLLSPHCAGSSMHQDLMENYMLAGGEGSSTGVFLQPGFQPSEPTEMQLFPNMPTAQTTFGGTQTNVELPQWTQSGGTEPLGIPLGSSEPYLVEQSNTVPQDSHEVQIPPPSVEQNQFDTGNSEFCPGLPFVP